jgi:hypothetical protein
MRRRAHYYVYVVELSKAVAIDLRAGGYGVWQA